jgi:hypothetical protein
MFLKVKNNADGTFNKLKARLVAGGNEQDRTTYSDHETSSMTCTIQSFYAMITLASKFGLRLDVTDIPTAYLNSDMIRDVYMELNETISNILCSINPDYFRYQDRISKKITVQLKKALYGCVESGKLWNDRITTFLKSIDYIPNPYDPCVFHRNNPDSSISYLSLYVDDLLFACSNPEHTNSDIAALEREFNCTLERSNPEHLQYLGIDIEHRLPHFIKLSMPAYVDQVLQLANIPADAAATTPAAHDLFTIRDSPHLNPQDAKLFHSSVARLLYLSKRIRPDILTTISFLTTRVQAPTVDDLHKLNRCLYYLNSHKKYSLIFEAESLYPSNISTTLYTDASYGIHSSGNSHSGAIILMCNCPIYFSSKKQSIIAKSSCEAELIALSTNIAQLQWLRNFLSALGLAVSTVYQDNLSTMSLVQRGYTTSSRSRHINVRFFYSKSFFDNGRGILTHLPTDQMLADILTKPLQGALFLFFLSYFLQN